MSRPPCPAPIQPDALVAYWLGELDESAAAQVDEHLLACSDCAGQLQALVELRDGIRNLVHHGRFHGVFTGALPKRLAEAGLRVREYHVSRGGSVQCTIAPDDDVVIAHLDAPLTAIRQLDVLVLHPDGRAQERFEHVPFDPCANEVVVVPGSDELRALPQATMRMQLIAVERGSDRLVGEYTFHHTPWAQLQG